VVVGRDLSRANLGWRAAAGARGARASRAQSRNSPGFPEICSDPTRMPLAVTGSARVVWRLL